MSGLVGALVLVGMVVVAPLGLRRLGTPGVARLVRWWPALGVLAGAGLLADRGALAVALVLPYATGCAVVGVLGAARAVAWPGGPREDGVVEVVVLTAAASLPVAALALVAERAGHELLGFSLPVLGLTVAHFHFAGFAAVILAGLTARVAPASAAVAGALAVPVGTALVAVGHFTGRATELAGSVVLAAGLLTTSWVLARGVARRLEDRLARRLLLVAAGAAPVTMALAVWFALGRLTGLPHLSIAETAATHGVLNALAVAVCGLAGWARVAPRPL